jgi:hypothetical protein
MRRDADYGDDWAAGSLTPDKNTAALEVDLR